MKKIRAAVVGYGNIGKFSLQALEAAPDFEVAGIVRRQGDKDKPAELAAYEVVDDISKLKDVDVAILATPTRSCPDYAKAITALGINTVDSYDIHTSILDYRTEMMPLNKQTNTVSVIGRLGPRLRLYSKGADAEPCSQGTDIYKLRSGHVHGTFSVRKEQEGCEECLVHDNTSR